MRLFSAFILLLTLSFSPAFAAAPSVIALKYGLYSGGFQALDVTLTFRLSADRYDAQMVAKPSGTLGRLLPWGGTYHTVGTIQNGKLRPTRHEKSSQWRKDQDETILTYNAAGVLTRQQEASLQGGKKNAYDKTLDVNMHRGTVDIVTAVSQMLVQVSHGKDCTLTLPVYDGKRRFDFVFRDKGETTLAASKINAYKGKAALCEMELIPKAGFTGKPRGYYRIQEEGKELGQLPNVAVGRFTPTSPYAIPLRMTVKSSFGTMLLHVRSVSEK